MYKVGDVIELTQDVCNRAYSYKPYFSDTGGIMPRGKKFKVIALRDGPINPVYARLLVDGVEILQTGGYKNCYSSLISYEIRLASKSKTLALLKAIRSL